MRWNEPFQKLATCDTDGGIFVWIQYEGRWSVELVNDRGAQVKIKQCIYYLHFSLIVAVIVLYTEYGKHTVIKKGACKYVCRPHQAQKKPPSAP